MSIPSGRDWCGTEEERSRGFCEWSNANGALKESSTKNLAQFLAELETHVHRNEGSNTACIIKKRANINIFNENHPFMSCSEGLMVNTKMEQFVSYNFPLFMIHGIVGSDEFIICDYKNKQR